MARDLFTDTVGMVDSAGNYKPLSTVQVTVYQGGTTTPVTIYVGRTGSTQKANPFTTPAGGTAEFWADVGDYDILFHDLIVPARIGDKTIGWNATSGLAGGTPSNRIAGDAGLPYAALDAVSGRQDVPIGGVIAWWRPSNAVAIPTGYAACDGATVTVTNHDFGTGGSIVLPDLRNKFILGANSSLTDDTVATTGDAVGNAPGIRGAGGSHAHTHTIVNDGPGTSTNGSHSHGIQTDAENGHTFFTGGPYGGMPAGSTGIGHIHGGGTDTHTGHSHTVNAHAHGGATGPQNNSRPLYVGLLYIIKIKRN